MLKKTGSKQYPPAANSGTTTTTNTQSRKTFSTAVMSEYAWFCRQCYIAIRGQYEAGVSGELREYVPGPKFDGGYSRRASKTYDSIWPGVARFLLKNDLNPSRYMAYQFAKTARQGKPLFPNQITSRRLLHAYVSDKADEHDARTARNMLVTAKRVARTRISYYQRELGTSYASALKIVLSDDMLPLTNLFRYCLAESEGLKSLARKFKVSAFVQYTACQEAYDDSDWRDWLPQHFTEGAGIVTALSLREARHGEGGC